ncbi:hypothetical protein AMTR_s00004p00146770 [Amborella trichopoda]|uniref:Alpha/beta hydrolase fold-3 domain-containing protein n=1 Tax=Amborella trichopoda TaxID=13333 RepID=W1NE36_AMBTC|nr:hypothetical protein AMTR_s00004p00146770 [Amborella trichopoda]
MSSQAPYEIENCRGLLRVFSDGSTIRISQPEGFQIPIDEDGSVSWKDLQFDLTLDLNLRLYKPLSSSSRENNKLPILFYFHGGGFCIGSRTWPVFHNTCLRLSRDLQAIVVSPDYRLAPENRLPAAISDAFSAVWWLASAAACEPFLSEIADFERGVLTIKGFVLLNPAFAGVERTQSEITSDDDFLNLELCDRYWRLSLPEGADRDHPLVNVFGPGAAEIGSVEWRPMLLVVAGRDPLKDREMEYGRRLKEMGKRVEVVVFEGKKHAFFTMEPECEASKEVMVSIREFMEANV